MIYDIPAQANEIPRLEDYLRAIRERWKLLVAGGLLLFLAALLFENSRVPSYEAEAKVVVNPTISNAYNNNLVRPVLEREKEVLVSNAVATRAAEELGQSIAARVLVRDLGVTFVNDSDTLSLTYSSTDAAAAAVRVNAVAAAYVALREEASLEIYNSQIVSLTTDEQELDEKIVSVGDDIASANSDRRAAEALAEASPSRQSRIDEASELLDVLNEDLRDVKAALSVVRRDLRAVDRDLRSRNSTAEVIQVAERPESPAGPGRSLILAAGLVLGVMGGASLAFVLDRLDRRAKGSADVEAALGTTVLGSVPSFGVSARRVGVMMTSHAKSARSQRIRESYRRIRASLQFLQTSKNIATLVVTSARPGEGKSTFVANIGVAAAQAGTSVALVSADLRRPRLEKLFGLHVERGLSTYLANPTATDILVPIPEVDGLVLIPAGPQPPNPGELLASAKFGELLSELKDQYDLVLIDMPPVLSAADAGAASVHADGVILVVDAQGTNTDDLLRIRTTLERSGATLVGAILNKDNTDSGVSLRRDRYAYEKVASRT